MASRDYASAMHIALATCSNLPDWEVDDRPLHEALRGRDVEFSQPSWDDAAFDWSQCDVCLIRTTWDYQDNLSAFLEWIERVDQQTLLLNPAKIIQWNSHKSYLRALQSSGVPTVETEWLMTGADVDVKSILEKRNWQRAFIKPAIGATARETLRFDNDAAGIASANDHIARLLPHEDLMMQPYLENVETFGEVSAIFIDGQFSHGVRKIPVAGDYRVQDDFGASDEPYTFPVKELAVAQHAIDQTGEPLLYGRCDFLRDDAGDLRLTEMELIEPSLFFRHDSAAAKRLADAICERIGLQNRPQSR